MPKYSVRVTDRRSKYESKMYEITASGELEACIAAGDQFIADNKHPPYRPGQRMSVYYSRFCVEIVK